MKRRACRICRCTSSRGCASNCGWAEADLCTVCAEIQDRILALCMTGATRVEIVAYVMQTPDLEGFREEGDLDETRARRAVRDLIATGALYEHVPPARLRSRERRWLAARRPRATARRPRPKKRARSAPAAERSASR